MGETAQLLYGTDVITNSDRLYVGSPYRVGSLDESGHVYVYDIATGALIHDIEAPLDAENRYSFGANIEVDGTTIVVSTDEGRDHYQSGKDQVFVYDAITGDFMFELIPLSPMGEFYYDFGYDIAMITISSRSVNRSIHQRHLQRMCLHFRCHHRRPARYYLRRRQ